MARAGTSPLFIIFVFALGLLASINIASAREKDAALVMDASNGKILYERSAHETRYPASLTKMMTVFMAFDALEKGTVNLSTVITASPEAASQPPTRLGLRSGSTLTMEDAIKAAIVRSANDASVAIAEHLAGTEDRFAVMMTAKARELGMRNTVFRNASGLPNIDQYSTAYDLALLSRRLMTDHAKYYAYFNTRSFSWNGKSFRGHNNLLTYFDGADGLKTGYTRLSGYNLATSAARRGVRLIGVVLGGASAHSRDVQMAEMLESIYTKMGLGRPPAVVIAMSPLVPDEDEIEGYGSQRPAVESAGAYKPASVPQAPVTAAAVPGLQPILPRTRPAAVSAPAPAPAPITTQAGLIRKVEQTPTEVRETVMSPTVPDDPEVVGRKGRKPAAQATRTIPNDAPATAERQTVASLPAQEPRTMEGELRRIQQENETTASRPAATQDRPSETRSRAPKPGDAKVWGIQVGAFDEKKQAEVHLKKVKGSAREILGKAKSAIVPIKIKAEIKYRVRFGPFEQAKAGEVCRKLLSRKIKCGTVPGADWADKDGAAVTPLADNAAKPAKQGVAAKPTKTPALSNAAPAKRAPAAKATAKATPVKSPKSAKTADADAPSLRRSVPLKGRGG